MDIDALADRGWDEVMERGTSGIETPNAVSASCVPPEPRAKSPSTAVWL